MVTILTMAIMANIFVFPTTGHMSIKSLLTKRHITASKSQGLITTTHLANSIRVENLNVKGTITLTGWKDPYFDLAAHWAPVIYQDTDSTYYKGDYITRFDFDGDWVGNNNWENLDNYDLIWAYVYYAVIETETHYFIFYMFFHPRDWNDIPDFGLGEHENDMEGAMVVITKDGSQYGSFLLMETRAHLDFYQYTNDPNIGSKNDTVDGGVILQNGRPTIFIEAKGHGVYAWDGTDFPGGDGVVYYYINNQTDYPTGGNDRNVSYALIPIIKSLWPRRYDIGNGRMYDDPFVYSGARYGFQNEIGGAFDGDTNVADAANPPWGMDDGNDGPVYRGDWFFDPAYTVDAHLSIPYDFSLNYVYNPYLIENGPEWNYPSITVNSPVADTYYNTRTILVDFTVNDDSDLYSVTVTINGLLFYSSKSRGSHSFTYIAPSDGVYTINITAIDIWGNYRSVEFEFYVDTAKPYVWATIENNSWLSSQEISFDWYAQDNLGVDRVVIALDGITIATRYGESGSETIALSSEGEHIISLEAYDFASNTNRTVYVIHVDFNPPTIVIMSPQNETITDNSSITLRWDSNDSVYLLKHEVYLDGSLLATLDNSTTQFIVNSISEGEHRIRVVAYDYIGHSAYDEIVVYVDRTPPLVNIVSPQNSSLVPKEFNITWNASDNMQISRIEILIDGELYAEPDADLTCYPVALSEGGHHNVSVVVYDIVNFSSEATIEVYCDLYPPTVDILVENGSVFETDLVFIEWDVQEDYAVSERYVIVDDNEPLPVYKDNITLALSDGEYLITVRIVDEAGNIGEDSITIFVDTAPPEVTIISPTNNSYLSQTKMMVVWDSYDQCGIIRTEIYVDGKLYLPQNSSMDIVIDSEGQHNITVVVWDHAENSDKSMVFITVDLSAPIIVILSPQNGSKYEDNITLMWSANDSLSGVSKIRVFINDSIYGEFKSSTGNKIISLESGFYIITVEAIDNANNSASIRTYVYMAYLAIISPINNFNTSSRTINITIDCVYVYSVEVYMNNSYVATFVSDQQITLSIPREGVWEIMVADSDKLSIQSTVFIRADWTVPQVVMGNLPEYTNSSTVKISWNANDEGSGVRRYELYVNGTKYWGGKTNRVWISLSEGVWNITVVAIDFADNRNSTWGLIAVDLTPPKINLSITNGTIFETVYVLISWNATDNLSGASNVSLYLNAVFQGTYNTSDIIELMLENGRYRITLRTKDLAGNSGYTTAVFRVSAPSVILVYGPENASYIANDTISVSWELFNGKIVRQEIYLDGELINVSDTNIILSDLPDGMHNLTIVVEDNRGEVQKAVLTFYVDTTPPQLEILEPTNESYINTTRVLIRIKYSDNFGVSELLVMVNGTPANISLVDSFYLELGEGYNIIKIRIYDRAGNYDEEVLRLVVDITSPIVRILEPTNGTRTNSTEIVVRWLANDNMDVERTEIWINETRIAVLYGSVDEYTIYMNSTVTVKVVVYDLAGNSNLDEIVIIYVSEHRNDEENSGDNSLNLLRRSAGSIVGLLLVVIIVLTATAIIRKKRKKRVLSGAGLDEETETSISNLGEALEEIDQLFEDNL